MAHPSVRARALQLLIDIEDKGAYANLALQEVTGYSPRDRALLTELVNGTTRRRLTLDHVLRTFVTSGLDSLTSPIRNNLRLGAYQLLFTTHIPAHAAIDEAVKLAYRFGHPGVAKLTNAVLRRVQREGAVARLPAGESDPVEALSIEESLPSWIIARWVRDYGFETARALAEDSNRALPLSVRVNTLKTTREQLLAMLADADIQAEASPVVADGIRFPSGVALGQLPAYNEGMWYVQGEAAMLTSRIVDPRPGETVADVGAAPGGKTTHLAALMEDRGSVLAIDPHEGRLGLVAENAERLGEHIIRLCPQDGTVPLETPVDRALVDAPCSGLGVLYRRSDLRWRQTPEQLAALPAEQAALLANAARAVKPGGALVYATCTLHRAENEGVVREFLAEHPEFKPGELASYLPEAWRADVEEGMIQLMPHRHGVEGFFIARLERTDG